MPRFLITVILGALFWWGIIVFLVLNTIPTSYLLILVFIVALHISLGLTLSLPLFFVIKRKAPEFIKDSDLYKSAFKIGMFISFGVSVIFLLKALDLINIFNFGLFCILYVLLFFQIKGKK